MLMEAPIASSIYRDVVNTPFCDIRESQIYLPNLKYNKTVNHVIESYD